MKDIPGYEGLYAATEDGRVWSYHRNSWKVATPHGGGYLYMSLYRNGVGRNHLVHRLIAVTFITNPEMLPEVNHRNLVKTDNRVDNLEWTDRAGNVAHSHANGRTPTGERQWNAKLTEEDVRDIRMFFDNGIRITDIHRVYPVSFAHVYNLAHRKRWKHID